MANVLNQRLVTLYGKYSALKNLLDKWIRDRRDLIVAALQREKCPEAGPFLLELECPEDGVSWKEEFAKHPRKHDGMSQDEVDAHFKRISDRPRETHPRLVVKRNPNYRRKFPIRLPA